MVLHEIVTEVKGPMIALVALATDWVPSQDGKFESSGAVRVESSGVVRTQQVKVMNR